MREQREGEGNVLLAGSTGQLQWRKVAQGQVHKMPRLVFISSCRTKERERKMLKVDFRNVARERLFHHILL